MTSLHPSSFIMGTIFCISSALFATPSRGDQKIIDPHWTGKHCTECHAEEQEPELKFDGDVVRVCYRCHQHNPPVCMKVHPKYMLLTDNMEENLPEDWPLVDSKTTCLTCHAVRLQMHANNAEKKRNAIFLRSSTPENLSRFCFTCHSQKLFQKTNPHRDTLNRSTCFRCHTQDLASSLEDCFEASLKTKSPALCLGCHGNLFKGHITHEKLLAGELKATEADLHKLEREGIELPLADGRMHCATCHNPHPQGIIGRKQAAIGAGEKYYLRISDSQTLCAVCHKGTDINKYIKRFIK